jgi:predicted CxxxxCH...CXXCH cytochrome family protein
MVASAGRRCGSRAPLITSLAIGVALAGCGADPGAQPAGEPAPRSVRQAAVGDVCAATGAHAAHERFSCAACHPCGGAFGFDVPVLFPGGTTSAGGTLSQDASGVTCTVACHAPKSDAAAPVSWATTGPLACTSCHAPAVLPGTHPPVLASATRAECEACHLLDQHTTGTVVVLGHDAPWSDPGSPRFHAFSANTALASCRGCHGPELTGGAATACATCHDVSLPEGVASWKVNCVMCHGGDDLANGAPPKATWGNGADAVRIGAHTRHLTPSAIAPAAECTACHAVPADALAPGHVDGGTAEVVFARAPEGATPTWDRPNATCSGTYCHGGGLAGGTNTAPIWTRLGEGQADCGSCHGLPPPSPHPLVRGGLADCNICHADTVDATGTVIPPADGGKHLDGLVEATGGHAPEFIDPSSGEFHAYAANRGVGTCQTCHGEALDGVGGMTPVGCTTCHGEGFATRCTGCHGGLASASGAPPRTTWGGDDDPLRVGAHTRHLAGGSIAGPVPCAACHVVPADAFAPDHLGEPFAEVRFSGLAGASGAAPAWDRAAGTCSGTYCHGRYSGTYEYYFWEELYAFPYSRAGGTPSWTGAPMTCTSCHGNPPPGGTWHSGYHGGGNECSRCHPGVDAAGTAFTDRSRHVNGVIDVRWSGSGCSRCH